MSNDLWWFFQGCSPLPIPNREVKPLMADGTALQCGRVGSCHIYFKPLQLMKGFFYAPHSTPNLPELITPHTTPILFAFA